MRRILNIALIIISILTPYIVQLFFKWTISGPMQIILNFVSFITLIISVSLFIVRSNNKFHKWLIGIVAITSVATFILFYKSLLNYSNIIFFKLREKPLSELVFQIRKSNNIIQLMKPSENLWFINHQKIRRSSSQVDSTEVINKKHYLNDVLEREKIDKQQYEDLEQRLVELNLWGFKVKDDSIIKFWINRDHGLIYTGYLDDSIIYKQIELFEYNDKLKDNWYLWFNH